MVIEGEEPWPELEPAPDRRGWGLRQIAGVAEEPGPVFIVTGSMPPAVAEDWRDRPTLVTQEVWNARSNRLPAILFTPSSVRTVGPFVRLGVEYTTRKAQSEDEAPAGYSGGITACLMETGTTWVIVALSG